MLLDEKYGISLGSWPQQALCLLARLYFETVTPFRLPYAIRQSFPVSAVPEAELLARA